MPARGKREAEPHKSKEFPISSRATEGLTGSGGGLTATTGPAAAAVTVTVAVATDTRASLDTRTDTSKVDPGGRFLSVCRVAFGESATGAPDDVAHGAREARSTHVQAKVSPPGSPSGSADCAASRVVVLLRPTVAFPPLSNATRGVGRTRMTVWSVPHASCAAVVVRGRDEVSRGRGETISE